MKYLKYIGLFLNEGKLSDLEEAYNNKLNSHEIASLKIYSLNSSSNFAWLLKNYSKDKVNYKDNPAGVNILLDVLDDYFKRYLRIKSNLPMGKRDINSLKSTYELINLIDEYNDYDKMKEDKGIDILFENEKWVVFIPKTFDASNKWGWGRFCSSSDEGYFHYHNINNKSLVYIMHKFDYTKNIVIEGFPYKEYQIWNYQDDNSWGGEGMVYKELNEIDDGFLNIDKIMSELPDITQNEFTEHLAKIISKLELEDINTLLETDYEIIDYDNILEYINDEIDNILDLRDDLREFI